MQEKQHKIELPAYSLAEELISSISHGVGALLGIAALVICIVISVQHNDPWAIVSSCVYGATLMLLYTMSTIYHALKINKAKRVFRVIDHCSIYLLIAGTYTPYTLVALRGAVGWVLFGVVWAAAIAGIVVNAIDLKKYRVFSMITYLLMGWAIVFAFVPLQEVLPKEGLWLLFGGGIIFTIGAVFYAIGKKYKYMHSVFHFFVLAGSILHFFSIVLYVI